MCPQYKRYPVKLRCVDCDIIFENSLLKKAYSVTRTKTNKNALKIRLNTFFKNMYQWNAYDKFGK